MSNNSKGKAITDLLMSDMSKWWSWDEIMEALIPGFSMVPSRAQGDILETYMTYLPHVYAEADNREKFVLRIGIALEAKFKIATSEPEDKPYVEARIGSFKKREQAISGRIENRIENLKKEGILPPSWTPGQLEQ
jgi:hypothetical protein